MIIRLATAFTTLALTSLLLSGCNAPEGNASKGKRWYSMNNCASCHGPNANDGRAAAIAATGLRYQSFVNYLREPDSPSMPPFSAKKLSDQDAADIYAWLQSIPE